MNKLTVALTTLLIASPAACPCSADETPSSRQAFERANLVAWCIVPFDAKQRGPAERAEMVKRLGLQRVAYDWRAKHVPTFEDEIEQYKKHNIEFFAFWSWHDSLQPLIEKHGIKPQIWLMLPAPQGNTEPERVAHAAKSILPMVERTRQLGLKLGLYNHGGWGGEPENMVAVCDYLREHHDGDHVGIVYNFHHGHAHVGDFAQSLKIMAPRLLCLNLNGMADPSVVEGNKNKILPIGSGKHEREMIQQVIREGYDGPIGILDHRSDTDAEIALRENLDGLAQVLGAIED